MTPTVYVTGMAWVTPLGDDLASVWRRLLAGESGLVPLAGEGRLRNDLAAAVADPPLDVPAATRQRALAARALRLALQDAGGVMPGPDTPLIVGTSLGAYLDGPDGDGAPLDAWARDVAGDIAVGVEPIVVSTACSSGSDAIALGFELIRAGHARRCVCGAGDILSPAKRLAHSTLGTMSPTRLRAFDVRHDGTLLGEGAGFVVLDAAPGGRSPYAVMRGAGAANDAVGLTAPDASGAGARDAIDRSLADAGLRPRDVGIVNAHGSGTPLNDATEAEAFRTVFAGAVGPVVFATKGNFGHTLGATGVLEAIATILALGAGELPPIVGLEEPDPAFPLELARSQARPHRARVGLSLTLGFGGFDTSLVFEAHV